MLENSPYISSLRWGRISVEGLGSAKDFKLWPGGGREWNWGETDTHHDPGIQIADVTELIEQGSTTVVLSRGILRMLKTCESTLALLEQRGITVHVAETRRAVELYNDLASAGVAVGGLFHSTC